MATLVLTVTESLRYRGKIGQWSWMLHRIAGLGTVLFLFLHVIDTSWAVFYPELYKEAIAQYQSPLFTVGEFALVACVIYHALNGLRVVILDWRPRWWFRQAAASRLVFGGTLVLLIPTFVLMFGHVLDHYREIGGLDLKLREIVTTMSQFALGVLAILVLSLVVSVVYAVIPGVNAPRRGHRSRFDSFMWLFMRISGLLIIPLVFGHLGMMHVIQGVFDITTKNVVPVGANLTNITGNAWEFVAIRWNTMFAGVFIWRVYDVGLLLLAVAHGFNGLRNVVNDYAHNVVVNRSLNIAILTTAVGLMIVGALAIINTVPADTLKMIEQAAQTVR